MRRGLRVELVEEVVERRSSVLLEEGVPDRLSSEERRVRQLEAEVEGEDLSLTDDSRGGDDMLRPDEVEGPDLVAGSEDAP
jgi:hypothetical protein